MDKHDLAERVRRWLERLPEYARQYGGPSRDHDLRLMIFTKAFHIWPLHKQQSMELTLVSCIEETSDAPVFALEWAVQRSIRNRRDDPFRPPIGSLLFAAAYLAARVRVYARGYSDWVTTPSVDSWVPSEGINEFLRYGRRIVGQPDPDPQVGMISPAFGATMQAVLGGGDAQRDAELDRMSFVGDGK